MDHSIGTLLLSGIALGAILWQVMNLGVLSRTVASALWSIVCFQINAQSGDPKVYEVVSPSVTNAPPTVTAVSSNVVVDPTGKFVYLKLGTSIRMYKFDEDKTSILPIPGSPFDMEKYSWGFAIHSSGRFLYAADYQQASITGYSVDTQKGTLMPIPGSPFAAMEWLEPLTISGNVLTLKSRKTVGTYEIDPETGSLTLLGKSQRIVEPQLPAEEATSGPELPVVKAVQAEYFHQVVNRDSEISLLSVDDGLNKHMCVNLYAFSADEKLISCCSCPIPYGNLKLSTEQSLLYYAPLKEQIKNVLVRIVNTIHNKTTSCANGAAKVGSSESPLNPGRTVFATTIDSMSIKNPSSLAEGSFHRAKYSPAELAELSNRCAQLKSPHLGICRDCREGAIHWENDFGQN